MCGRCTLGASARPLAVQFGLDEVPADLETGLNIAPTQQAPVVRHLDALVRRLALGRWGMVPSWAEDLKVGHIPPMR